MRKALLAIVISLSAGLSAQETSITFDFDSNLSGWEQSSPNHWDIDTATPINGVGSLHQSFDTSISAFDVISYSHTQVLLDSAITQWQFKVRYDYTPSSSNNWAMWLTGSEGVENMNPSGSASGYVVGVNYAGSDDLLKIWKQENGIKNAVLTTTFNWQELVNVGDIIELSITRSMEAEWEISIKLPEMPFETLTSSYDNSLTTSDYLGIYYEYTSTQDMKLWVDDIVFNAFFYDDIQPPIIKSLELLSSTELIVEFNESIDTVVEPLIVLNYKKRPTEVRWLSPSRAQLKFEESISEDNLLEVYNLSDTKGNVSQVTQIEFKFVLAEKYDVIINEIMADPSPVVGLPDCEYIELYNRTDKRLNLNGWSFISGDRDPLVISDLYLAPQSYVLFVEDKYLDEFSMDIPLHAVSDLPTLPNNGEKLMLLNDVGRLIHAIEYDYNTYNDDAKKEGGWSMELIDESNPCIVKNNWSASESSNGGTPGYRNSVAGTIANYPRITLSGIKHIEQTSCLLQFSHPFDSLSATVVENYQFLNHNADIIYAKVGGDDNTQVEVGFSNPIEYGEQFTMRIQNLEDCSGLTQTDMTAVFGVPEQLDSADIVISEILYEANDEKPEYIELYNDSEKVININGFLIASLHDTYDTIKTKKSILDSDYLFFPRTYLVLTENKLLLSGLMPGSFSDRVIELGSWLSLTNGGGKIALLDNEERIVDQVIYSPEQHFKLLSNTSGVSLERVSFVISGMDKQNWHSAATNVNYSTPGQENSQFNRAKKNESIVSVNTNEFSPDNDGNYDILEIAYRMPELGYLGDIKIFDQQGRIVTHLINNELLELDGSYFWDGLGENGERLAMGYYIVLFEGWNPNGNKISEKLIVLLLPEKK